jgi:ribulose-5-phosphate 4-epimerase/fuculose-1-phosphate aldolase
LAYDNEYGGLALDPEEGARITSKLENADVLFMANHGVLICGDTIANAFDDLYYLERAANVQVIAQSTGGKLRIVPDAVAKATAAQFEQERQQSALHFAAIKGLLGSSSPGWSEN